MADRTSTHTTETRSSTGIAFVVGALVVAVGVIAFVLFGGADESDDVTISVEGAGAAAQDVGNAVEDAAQGAANAVEGAANDAANAVDNATSGN